MNTYPLRHSRGPRPSARGFSLIEIMIALVLGLVVIGAVLSNYLATVRGQGSGAALSQMSEDAGVAFNIIRRQVAMAGYSEPTGYNADVGLSKRYTGPTIFGCNTGFTASTAATMSALTCTGQASADPPLNAIAVAFQADDSNSIIDTGTTNAGCTPTNPPRDVTGSRIDCDLTADVPYLAQARFYVNDGALKAWGSGGDTARMVENIVAMRIWYGLSSNNPAGIPMATPTRYVDANTVGALPSAASWQNVRAVRVCLVVKSENEILDEVTPYYGCDAIDADNPTTTTPGDRALYRAFTSTIMIQNL